MVIVFVTDIFCDAKNGTAKTAFRFAEALQARGHEIRVLSVGDAGPDNYYVEEHRWGPISALGHLHGFSFAKYQRETVYRALEGADLVHFLLPLPFEWQVLQTVKKLGIPRSAAFHLQPENFTYIIHADKIPKLDDGVYYFLRDTFFKHFRHIHCPSRFIAGELQKHRYQGNLFVLSNGVDTDFVPPETYREPDPDCFRILMTGRLSPEKCQHTLIEAMRYSKYADKIQIYFAGSGQEEHRLRRLGSKLQNPPDIRFYKQSALIERLHSCDLYVHTATVEIEAISCLEAIACGLVPVICNSPKSATVQFAQDERSLFRNNDPVDLARKIDYWIEHPEEKKRMSAVYAAYGKNFSVADSVRKIEVMFQKTIADFQKGEA